VEVQLHEFLTSALDKGEWPASRPGRFTHRKRDGSGGILPTHLPRRWMWAGYHLYAPAALWPEKEPLVPIWYEAGQQNCQEWFLYTRYTHPLYTANSKPLSLYLSVNLNSLISTFSSNITASYNRDFFWSLLDLTLSYFFLVNTFLLFLYLQVFLSSSSPTNPLLFPFLL